MTQDLRAGLCAQCVHGQRIPHPRAGNDYWMCRKAEEDKSMPKYPRLPVLGCRGYRPASEAPE